MRGIPKTNERPKGPAPNCKCCGKKLESYWRLEWPISSRQPISQTWCGWGPSGNGFFCSKGCGYHFAVDVMRRVEFGREKTKA